MLEATQRENQRKVEAEERENQRKDELDREKLRVDEKLQLEKVNLERLKIEADANLKIDKFRHEVEELTAQNHSTVSKRTSGRLPRIELKIFGGQIIKWKNFGTHLKLLYTRIRRYNQSKSSIT